MEFSHYASAPRNIVEVVKEDVKGSRSGREEVIPLGGARGRVSRTLC